MRALLFRSAVASLVMMPILVAAAPPVRAMIRYDGLYCARTSEGYTEYLRFYADGRVVVAVSNATPTEVARWLRTGYSALGDSDGTYRIARNKLTARVAVHRGQPGRTGNSWVEYTGTVTDDALLLHSHSRLTGHAERLRFTFVPIQFGPAKRRPNQAMQLTAVSFAIDV